MRVTFPFEFHDILLFQLFVADNTLLGWTNKGIGACLAYDMCTRLHHYARW